MPDSLHHGALGQQCASWSGDAGQHTAPRAGATRSTPPMNALEVYRSANAPTDAIHFSLAALDASHSLGCVRRPKDRDVPDVRVIVHLEAGREHGVPLSNLCAHVVWDETRRAGLQLEGNSTPFICVARSSVLWFDMRPTRSRPEELTRRLVSLGGAIEMSKFNGRANRSPWVLRALCPALLLAENSVTKRR